MIKVALEASALQGKQALRGVGFYTERLLQAFDKTKPAGFKIEVVKFPYRQSNRDNYRLVHFPYFDPFFLTLPFKRSCPTVVTVHDLIPIKFASHFPKGLRGFIKWQFQKLLLRQVEAIITDSEASRKDIAKIISYPKEKIYRIYLAAGEEFKKVKTRQLKEVVQKYSLPKDFILYVGDLNWNKNVVGLLKSFCLLKSQRPKLKLVLVGKAFLEKDLLERRAITEFIKKRNLSNEIKFVGFVSTAELVALYRLASCYCQLSFYEGFGLPVLEAMACGCPVVCSNKGSLPEIVGRAAVLVDPYKEKKTAEVVNEVLSNKKLQKKLSRAGLRQAKKFSWKKTAKETLDVYKRVLRHR